MDSLKLKAAFKTDIGRRRKQNQDNGASRPELGLFLVSDGMGGHQGGETASAIAVQTICQCIEELEKASHWDPQRSIFEALSSANRNIYQESLRDSKLQGMGTTTTALLFKGDELNIGHVGDSRCYFFRSGCLWQLTRDHSMVQEKLRAGLISREQLKTDKMKNVITRSVGFEENIEIDHYRMKIQKDDAFLICSDGLTGPLVDEEILEIIQKNLSTHGSIEGAVESLIAGANEKGGDDNITSIIIQIMETGSLTP